MEKISIFYEKKASDSNGLTYENIISMNIQRLFFLQSVFLHFGRQIEGLIFQ